MKATISKQLTNGRNLDGAKERVNRVQIVGRVNGQLQTVCDARFWMSRKSNGASPVYCTLWVTGATHTAGHGKASGYGYHKESAALQDAIGSAAIALTGDNYARMPDDATNDRLAHIAGCGERAMIQALRAIAVAAGAADDSDLIEV